MVILMRGGGAPRLLSVTSNATRLSSDVNRERTVFRAVDPRVLEQRTRAFDVRGRGAG